MSGGARKGERKAEVLTSTLGRIGGGALAAALLAVVIVMLVFGDMLVGDPKVVEPEDDKTVPPAAIAPVEAERRDKVVEAAEAVLNRWSQPALTYTEWWAGLEPLLTPGGRQAYAFTDPKRVPELVDLKAKNVVLNPSGATATVWFDTSDGQFGVDLSRKEATGKWLANRVVFPGEESMFA